MCTCYLAYRYISEKKVAIRKKEDIVFVVRYLLYLLYITYVYIICKQLLYNVLGTAKDQTFFTLKQVASLFCYQLLNHHLEILRNLREIYSYMWKFNDPYGNVPHFHLWPFRSFLFMPFAIWRIWGIIKISTNKHIGQSSSS